MNGMIKNVLVLTLITIVAGGALGYVYDITKEPITKQEELAKAKAYQSVFREAASFEETDSLSSDLQNAQEYLEHAGYPNESILEVLEAKDASGSLAGYVLSVVTHEGYGGDITISMGIGSDGTVKGVEILSISETAGLGMKATEDEFKKQFADKKVAKFVYSKTEVKEEFEIHALSGATITTNAVTNAVNAGLAYYQASPACSKNQEGGDTNEQDY